MLRSNMYIVQNIAYAEHSVGQQMNVYCNTLSITNTDIGTITDVIDLYFRTCEKALTKSD